MASSLLYCLTKAFLGSVKICTNASSLNSASDVTTGIRPTSSGMMPNLIKSSGSMSWKTSVSRTLLLAAHSCAKTNARRFGTVFDHLFQARQTHHHK